MNFVIGWSAWHCSNNSIIGPQSIVSHSLLDDNIPGCLWGANGGCIHVPYHGSFSKIFLPYQTLKSLFKYPISFAASESSQSNHHLQTFLLSISIDPTFMSFNGIEPTPSTSSSTQSSNERPNQTSNRGKQPSKPRKRYHGISPIRIELLNNRSIEDRDIESYTTG